MSLHLVFMSCNDIRAAGYSPAVAWHTNEGRPKYTHVEIHIDGIGLCNFRGRTFIPTLPEGIRMFTYQRVKLPEHMKDHILKEFNRLDFSIPYRHRDFTHASRDGYCARSLLKTGFTCATMTAYLLGLENYYSISADQLYNLLT